MSSSGCTAFIELDRHHAKQGPPQAVSDVFRRAPACIVPIEHENHRCEMLLRSVASCALLHRGTHERDARETGLRHFHAIEESFDEDDRQLPFHAMQVKEFERLVEACRKFVARFRSVDRSAGIGDEFALLRYGSGSRTCFA